MKKELGIGTNSPVGELHVYKSITIGGKWIPEKALLNLGGGLIMDSNEIYGARTLYIGSKSGDIIRFRTVDENGSSDKVIIKSDGTVAIGTNTTGTHKLAVGGSIGAREVKVEVSGWSDFVFEDDYNLPSLKAVEKHIKEKGHLQDIPSAEDVEKNGVNLGEMDAKLLQKIEELTLYVIQQNKENKRQQKEIDELREEIKELKTNQK